MALSEKEKIINLESKIDLLHKFLDQFYHEWGGDYNAVTAEAVQYCQREFGK